MARRDNIDVVTTGSAPTVMADSGSGEITVPTAGTMLGGKYRVERVLGQGGMGVVIEATHVGLMQRVAIKFLRNEAKAITGALDRFGREARACAQIQSEHVVRVFDTGVFETGEPYIVMELLAGEDLRTRLERRGVLSPSEAASFAIEACEALAQAHALGIVHRDLNPANLIVVARPDGSALLKVLDFGISKLHAEGSAQTSANVTLGSPRYMSPDQIKTPRDVDARTDVWALGVVLYEALAGRPPFDGDGMIGLATSIATERPAPLPQQVPNELAGVVMRCLEKDRRLRFTNVSDLALALRPFATTEGRVIADRVARAGGAQISPVSSREAPPISGLEPTVARSGVLIRQPSRRTEILVSAVVLLCLALAAALVWSLRSAHRGASAAVSSAPRSEPSSPPSARPVAEGAEAISAPTSPPSLPVLAVSSASARPAHTTVGTHTTTAQPAAPTAPAATSAAPPPRDVAGALRDRK